MSYYARAGSVSTDDPTDGEVFSLRTFDTFEEARTFLATEVRGNAEADSQGLRDERGFDYEGSAAAALLELQHGIADAIELIDNHRNQDLRFVLPELDPDNGFGPIEFRIWKD